MSARQEALAEAYRRNIMQPEQKAAYEEAMRRGLVQGPRQTAGQRALADLDERNEGASAFSGGIDMPWNRGFWGRAGDRLRETPEQMRRVGVGALADTWDAVTFWGSLTNPMIRRTDFGDRVEQPETASDEFGRAALPYIGGSVGVARGAAVVVPQLAGRALMTAAASGALTDAALSPVHGENLSNVIEDVGGPSLPTARREGENPGIAAVKDVAEGLVLGGAVDLGIRGIGLAADAVRPVPDFLRRAFTDRVTPRSPPEVVTEATGEAVEAVARPAGRPVSAEVERAPDVLYGAEGPPRPPADPNLPPDFASVKPMERRGFFAETKALDEKGVQHAVADWFQKGYTAIVDEMHPIVRLRDQMMAETERLTGVPENLRPSQDPMKLARGRYDVFNIGHMDILHGVHDYGTTKIGTPALADVVSAVGARFVRAGRTVENGVELLGKYAAARRAVVEWDRLARGELDRPPVRETREESQAFIDRMDKEEPEFRELSDHLNSYAQGLLKKKLDSGRIDRMTYDAAMAARDFYVPLQRVMEKTAGVGVGGTNKGPGVKAFLGSERDILNPIEVLVQETYRLAQQTRQNDLNLSIVRMAERLNGAMARMGMEAENGFIRKVERPVVKIADDTNQAELFDDLPEAFRTGEISEKGRAILYVWRDGRRDAYELLDPEWGKMVFEAVTAMTRHQEGLLTSVISAGTTFVSRTITRDPSFLVANFIRDQMQAWTLTDVGFKPGEGISGVVDELRQADSSRLYNLAGGISGGESSSAVGSTLRKRDVTELARRFDNTPLGARMRYVSDLKGVLRLGADAFRATELTETGTRRTLFKKSFERARREGLSEYDSLIEAAFTARDYADFGRHGSRMYDARRLVTFLNPWQQGMDKLVRTAISDPGSAVGRAYAMGGREAALKAILRPLFRNEEGVNALPVRTADKAALKLAVHAWTRMAVMGTFGLSLWAMFRDDEDYQQANETTRATHWTIPVGGGILARVPKPFETAFMSNIMERAAEATYGDDPEAWGKMWRGQVELFAPPKDAPLLGTVIGWQTGVDPRTNRPIVPEGLEDLPPELQYTWWTSQVARDWGKMLNVPPAKIDFVIRSMGGPMGAYALAASDAADPDRPSGSWVDLPVARRFFSPSFRGSQDKRDFYDRAGARTSELARASNGVREYEARNQMKAAEAIFDDLDEPGRLFVMSQRGEAATDRLNPIRRAQATGTHVGRMIGELNGARMKGDGTPLPAMTAQQRQMVSDALERVAVAEMGNAMIATGQPGFAQRNLRDRKALWEELELISPQVADELAMRMRRGADAAYDYETVIALWPQVAERLRVEGSGAYLDDLADEARFASEGERAADSEDAEPMNLTLN